MKKTLLTYFLVANIFTILNSQANNDYIWILGYPPNNPEKFYGGVKLDFNNNIPNPTYFEINCTSAEPAILCSNSGRLLAYSNGCAIYNSNDQIVAGGDSLNYGLTWEDDCEYGYPGFQNKLFLPWPSDSTKGILFQLKIADDLSTTFLLYSIIKFTKEAPLGIVTEKNIFLLSPGITGGLTAVKHANGRDWWVLLPGGNNDRVYSIILNEEAVMVIDSQQIGMLQLPDEGVIQTCFSPDGKKFIVYRPYNGFELFDFDRCTGILSKIIQSGPLSDTNYIGGGVSVSLNSRFLYASNSYSLFQYDLWSENVLSTKTLIGNYDGFLDPFSTTIHQMRLGPDGKIYIFASNGVKSIHSINHPELKGKACEFKQHNIKLPAYIYIGAVNTVNFRLGPSEFSACDSLGINNSPIADFRFEIDSSDSFHVRFKNLSYFDPTMYLWNFGNEIISNTSGDNEISYLESGDYKVCLTVKNDFGENTFCRIISIGDSTVTNSSNVNSDNFNIYPNPFTSNLVIISQVQGDNSHVNIISSVGQLVLKCNLNRGSNRINIEEIPAGVYFYQIYNGGKIISQDKIVKLN